LSKPKKTPETAAERDARIFPLATQINRDRREAGGEKIAEDDVRAYVSKWRDPDPDIYRFETEACARQILTSKWSDGKMREGRAKWGEYLQLSLLSQNTDADWEDIGTRSYSITLADGKQAHRCLFEMTDAQLQAVDEAFDKELKSTRVRRNDLRKWRQRMRTMGVPRRIPPSVYFLAKTTTRRPARKAA
jgi:hypothetical protein